MGDYEQEPGEVIFIGRGDTTDFLYISEGDRRLEVVSIGPNEFLADDLRSITFESNSEGTVAAAVIALPGQAPRRAPHVQLYDQREVTFASGEIRLAGSLVVPRGDGPFPALVFVHGSGPQSAAASRIDADRFARSGIATLAYDKRGVGGSQGDWRRVGFDELAGDVLAAVHFLRNVPRILSDKVGLFGVSQAGWGIPLAASRSDEIAFIVPVSGGAVTPTQQEAWRRRQNLEFQHVDERFIELGRKAAVMAFDWQRLHQTGRTPLPNPFADDQLNMYHDAPAVLREVRQPALAIFGGHDTLTPPYESASIWAAAFARRGASDFSVRVFPEGTHGILVAEKTGSPFEVLSRPRQVSGYFDTIVAWIHHHSGGPPFAAARQVDVEPSDDPIQTRGMERLSWYGSGAVQPWELLVGLVVLGSAVVAAPLGWLIRRARSSKTSRSPQAVRTTWLMALLGVVNLAILFGMMYVLYQVATADPHPLLQWLPTVWNVLVATSWVSIALSVFSVRACWLAWCNGWWIPVVRVYYTVVVIAALSWLPFIYYWDMTRPVIL
jgi:uncharacterized protein